MENEETIKATSSFKLSRTSKGIYSWEIKIYSDDLIDMKSKSAEMDTYAKEKYGGENEKSW